MTKNAGWGNTGGKAPAPRRVSSGSVSKPVTPRWRPKAQPAPKLVRDPEPNTSTF